MVIEKENISDKIINLIFPNVCGICGKISENSLCKKCENTLKKYIIIKQEEIQNRNYNELISYFNYNGIIRNNILNYKFKEKPFLAKTFVKFLSKQEKAFEIIKTYDKIVPVPISRKRFKERGYNQSQLIAKEISKYTKIEIAEKCLYKTKNIIEQSKLNKEERIKNVQGVYELKNMQILEDKKILLIDDIYTTGSTVNECCKTLSEAKPSKIGVLVLAVANEGNKE